MLGNSQACITQIGAVIARAGLDRAKLEIELRTINISSQMQTIASITSYGANGLRFSLTYFAYRVGVFRNVQQLMPPERNNAGFIMNEGGLEEKLKKPEKLKKSKK